MADAIRDAYVDRSDMIEEEFGKLALSVSEVENFFEYLPEIVPRNSVCMFFDDQAQVEATTGRGMRRTFEWQVSIYVHGTDRKDMQRRMKLIILGLQARFADNPKLSRGFSKPARLVNRFGPPRPVQVNDNAAALVKSYILSGEVAD